MSGFVLDTNIVIGLLDGRASARHILDQHGAVPSNSAVAQITRVELLGFAKLTATDEARIRAFLSAVSCLALDEHVEKHAIALRRRTRLTLPDALVVATAVANGRTLLTLDEKLDAAFQQAVSIV
jgi:predicted nucleic acid-binding protein